MGALVLGKEDQVPDQVLDQVARGLEVGLDFAVSILVSRCETSFPSFEFPRGFCMFRLVRLLSLPLVDKKTKLDMRTKILPFAYRCLNFRAVGDVTHVFFRLSFRFRALCISRPPTHRRNPTGMAR